MQSKFQARAESSRSGQSLVVMICTSRHIISLYVGHSALVGIIWHKYYYWSCAIAAQGRTFSRCPRYLLSIHASAPKRGTCSLLSKLQAPTPNSNQSCSRTYDGLAIDNLTLIQPLLWTKCSAGNRIVGIQEHCAVAFSTFQSTCCPSILWHSPTQPCHQQRHQL